MSILLKNNDIYDVQIFLLLIYTLSHRLTCNYFFKIHHIFLDIKSLDWIMDIYAFIENLIF